jgi:hypothetical protein
MLPLDVSSGEEIAYGIEIDSRRHIDSDVFWIGAFITAPHFDKSIKCLLRLGRWGRGRGEHKAKGSIAGLLHAQTKYRKGLKIGVHCFDDILPRNTVDEPRSIVQLIEITSERDGPKCFGLSIFEREQDSCGFWLSVCHVTLLCAPNGLCYWRWGGRGLCYGAEKTRSQKDTRKCRTVPQRPVHALLGVFALCKTIHQLKTSPLS